MGGVAGAEAEPAPEGAMAAGGEEGAGDSRRTVLLTGAQGQALELELAALGCEPTLPPAADGGGEGEAPRPIVSDGWEVFYDSDAYALTLRGCWLCERGGSWLLKMPRFEPTEGGLGVRVAGHDEVSHPPDILERIGLVQHAEVLRKGMAKNVERLLAQARVVPFARLFIQRRVCAAQLRAGSFAGQDAQGEDVLPCALSLCKVKFDVKYGEDAAIAEHLFQNGSATRELMSVTLASFRVSSSTSRAAAEGALSAALAARGYSNVVPEQTVCPEVLAYLHAFRPVHMRALLRAQAQMPTA